MSEIHSVITGLRYFLWAVLFAAGSVHAILPDEPKPKPAASVQSSKKPATPVDPMKVILANFEISGEWNVEGQRRDRTIMRGTLSVSGTKGASTYRGILQWSSPVSGLSVKQDVQISVSGDSVRIEGGNVEVLRGSGQYHPDIIELSIVESKIMRGTAQDVRGLQGNVTMLKK